MNLNAQTTEDAKKETNSKWIEEITSRMTPYASIRIGAGFTEEIEIS